jgi:hypothetical protein
MSTRVPPCRASSTTRRVSTGSYTPVNAMQSEIMSPGTNSMLTRGPCRRVADLYKGSQCLFLFAAIQACPDCGAQSIRKHSKKQGAIHLCLLYPNSGSCGPQELRAACKWPLCQWFPCVRSWAFMSFLADVLKAIRHVIRTACCVLLGFLRMLAFACRRRSAVEAENLFLRKQLALFQERKTKPRRADDSTRCSLKTRASRTARLENGESTSRSSQKRYSGCTAL